MSAVIGSAEGMIDAPVIAWPARSWRRLQQALVARGARRLRRRLTSNRRDDSCRRSFIDVAPLGRFAISNAEFAAGYDRNC
jgi:hypothetical protein